MFLYDLYPRDRHLISNIEKVKTIFKTKKKKKSVKNKSNKNRMHLRRVIVG